MTPEKVIQRRYPFYDENRSNADIELDGEQIQELMKEYADVKVDELSSLLSEKDKEIERLAEKASYWEVQAGILKSQLSQTAGDEEFDSEIEIGELLVRSADEDGDFFIKIGKNRSTSLGTEEMKDIVRFINYHLAQYEDHYPITGNTDRKEAIALQEFLNKNRVEVHFDESQQYLCYINYKEGDGAYGLGMSFFESLENGIAKYRLKFE